MNQAEQGFVVFLVGFAMLFVGGVYGGLAALFSLAGGYFHLKREDKEWNELTRQELLERYFELQKRLDHSPTTVDALQGWEAWPVVRWVRRHPVASAAILGAVATVVDVVLEQTIGAPRITANEEAVGIVSAVNALVSYSLFLVVAFLTGKSSRGAIVGAIYVAAEVLIALPLAQIGLVERFDSSHILSVCFSLAFLIASGALGGVGGTIQRRAVRKGRLQSNDGATLVAEMLEIQWRLEEDATNVTVLVVDAAKSTAMKVGADPLDVEYSFREYQTWIGEICLGFDGRIHSVAGDGAVVAFSEGASAMGAARRMQTDVARFNLEDNRLPKPFRLRLGLHAGRVAGDLNDVQFTEVIDIAAHVEEIAPVGGIAATATVISQIGEDGFLPLARDIDGQPVFIALVPTEG